MATTPANGSWDFNSGEFKPGATTGATVGQNPTPAQAMGPPAPGPAPAPLDTPEAAPAAGTPDSIASWAGMPSPSAPPPPPDSIGAFEDVPGIPAEKQQEAHGFLDQVGKELGRFQEPGRAHVTLENGQLAGQERGEALRGGLPLDPNQISEAANHLIALQKYTEAQSAVAMARMEGFVLPNSQVIDAWIQYGPDGSAQPVYQFDGQTQQQAAAMWGNIYQTQQNLRNTAAGMQMLNTMGAVLPQLGLWAAGKASSGIDALEGRTGEGEPGTLPPSKLFTAAEGAIEKNKEDGYLAHQELPVLGMASHIPLLNKMIPNGSLYDYASLASMMAESPINLASKFISAQSSFAARLLGKTLSKTTIMLSLTERGIPESILMNPITKKIINDLDLAIQHAGGIINKEGNLVVNSALLENNQALKKEIYEKLTSLAGISRQAGSTEPLRLVLDPKGPINPLLSKAVTGGHGLGAFNAGQAIVNSITNDQMPDPKNVAESYASGFLLSGLMTGLHEGGAHLTRTRLNAETEVPRELPPVLLGQTRTGELPASKYPNLDAAELLTLESATPGTLPIQPNDIRATAEFLGHEDPRVRTFAANAAALNQTEHAGTLVPNRPSILRATDPTSLTVFQRNGQLIAFPDPQSPPVVVSGEGALAGLGLPTEADWRWRDNPLAATGWALRDDPETGATHLELDPVNTLKRTSQQDMIRRRLRPAASTPDDTAGALRDDIQANPPVTEDVLKNYEQRLRGNEKRIAAAQAGVEDTVTALIGGTDDPGKRFATETEVRAQLQLQKMNHELVKVELTRARRQLESQAAGVEQVGGGFGSDQLPEAPRRGITFVKKPEHIDEILNNGWKPGPGMGDYVSFYHEGAKLDNLGRGDNAIIFDLPTSGPGKYQTAGTDKEGGIPHFFIKNARRATPEEIANWGNLEGKQGYSSDQLPYDPNDPNLAIHNLWDLSRRRMRIQLRHDRLNEQIAEANPNSQLNEWTAEDEAAINTPGGVVRSPIRPIEEIQPDLVQQPEQIAEQPPQAPEPHTDPATLPPEELTLQDILRNGQEHLEQRPPAPNFNGVEAPVREAAGGKPAQRGLEGITRRLQAEQAFGAGMSPEQLTRARQFMRLIGPEFFDDLSLVISKRPGARAEGHYMDGVMTLFRSALDNAMSDPSGWEQTFFHEAWHHIHGYLPEDMVESINRDFSRRAMAFREQNPYFATLRDSVTKDNNGRYALSTAGGQYLMQDPGFLTWAQEHGVGLVPTYDLVGKQTGFSIKWGDTYRYTNSGEWVAELGREEASRVLGPDGPEPGSAAARVIAHLRMLGTKIKQYAQTLMGKEPTERLLRRVLQGELQKAGVGPREDITAIGSKGEQLDQFNQSFSSDVKEDPRDQKLALWLQALHPDSTFGDRMTAFKQIKQLGGLLPEDFREAARRGFVNLRPVETDLTGAPTTDRYFEHEGQNYHAGLTSPELTDAGKAWLNTQGPTPIEQAFEGVKPPEEAKLEALSRVGSKGLKQSEWRLLDDGSKVSHYMTRLANLFIEHFAGREPGKINFQGFLSHLDALRLQFNDQGEVTNPSYMRGWKPTQEQKEQFQKTYDTAKEFYYKAAPMLRFADSVPRTASEQLRGIPVPLDLETVLKLSDIFEQNPGLEQGLTPRQVANILGQADPMRAMQMLTKTFAPEGEGGTIPWTKLPEAQAESIHRLHDMLDGLMDKQDTSSISPISQDNAKLLFSGLPPVVGPAMRFAFRSWQGARSGLRWITNTFSPPYQTSGLTQVAGDVKRWMNSLQSGELLGNVGYQLLGTPESGFTGGTLWGQGTYIRFRPELALMRVDPNFTRDLTAALHGIHISEARLNRTYTLQQSQANALGLDPEKPAGEVITIRTARDKFKAFFEETMLKAARAKQESLAGDYMTHSLNFRAARTALISQLQEAIEGKPLTPEQQAARDEVVRNIQASLDPNGPMPNLAPTGKKAPVSAEIPDDLSLAPVRILRNWLKNRDNWQNLADAAKIRSSVFTNLLQHAEMLDNHATEYAKWNNVEKAMTGEIPKEHWKQLHLPIRESYAPIQNFHKMFQEDVRRELLPAWGWLSGNVSTDFKNSFLEHRIDNEIPALNLHEALSVYIPTMAKTIFLEPALKRALPLIEQLPAPEKLYFEKYIQVMRGFQDPVQSLMRNWNLQRIIAKAKQEAVQEHPNDPERAISRGHELAEQALMQLGNKGFYSAGRGVGAAARLGSMLSFSAVVNPANVAAYHSVEGLIAGANMLGAGPKVVGQTAVAYSQELMNRLGRRIGVRNDPILGTGEQPKPYDPYVLAHATRTVADQAVGEMREDYDRARSGQPGSGGTKLAVDGVYNLLYIVPRLVSIANRLMGHDVHTIEGKKYLGADIGVKSGTDKDGQERFWGYSIKNDRPLTEKFSTEREARVAADLYLDHAAKTYAKYATDIDFGNYTPVGQSPAFRTTIGAALSPLLLQLHRWGMTRFAGDLSPLEAATNIKANGVFMNRILGRFPNSIRDSFREAIEAQGEPPSSQPGEMLRQRVAKAVGPLPEGTKLDFPSEPLEEWPQPLKDAFNDNMRKVFGYRGGPLTDAQISAARWQVLGRLMVYGTPAAAGHFLDLPAFFHLLPQILGVTSGTALLRGISSGTQLLGYMAHKNTVGFEEPKALAAYNAALDKFRMSLTPMAWAARDWRLEHAAVLACQSAILRSGEDNVDTTKLLTNARKALSSDPLWMTWPPSNGMIYKSLSEPTFEGMPGMLRPFLPRGTFSTVKHALKRQLPNKYEWQEDPARYRTLTDADLERKLKEQKEMKPFWKK